MSFKQKHRYTIESKRARGKYLNVEKALYDNGARIVLWDNPQMPETQWVLKRIAGDVYNIINVKSKKCINVAGASGDNGAKIHQWNNPNARETQFHIRRRGDAFTIQAVHSHKYVNVAGGANHNGTWIHQWDNPDSPDTQYYIREVPGQKKQLKLVEFQKNDHLRYTIESNRARGKFLNVHRASYDNGAKLVLWDNPQMPETQWHIKTVGGGAYNIVNVKSKKCINIDGNGKHNGALIQQWDNPHAPETQFQIHSVGDAVVIQAMSSGKFINVAGGAAHNGAKIHQWDNRDASETQWRINLIPDMPAAVAPPMPTGPFIEFVRASYKTGSDSGSGAKRDLGLYRPDPESYVSFGDANSSHVAVPAVHVSKIDLAIAKGEVSWSVGWQRVWKDEDSGRKLDYDAYVPKAPDGFVAIGMVAVFGQITWLGHHAFPHRKVLCVNRHHKQLVSGGVTAPNVWSDAGTGAKWDLTLGLLAHGLLWPTHSTLASPPASYNFIK